MEDQIIAYDYKPATSLEFVTYFNKNAKTPTSNVGFYDALMDVSYPVALATIKQTEDLQVLKQCWNAELKGNKRICLLIEIEERIKRIKKRK